MRLAGEPAEESVVQVQFSPSGRDNMIAIMAARADAPNYGRLIAYTFPKQKLVYGPRNIDARINQDPVISQQISLWNQQGNRVLRGALPELRRVVVAYGNQIAMEPTLELALQRIFGGRLRVDEATPRTPEARPT